MSVLKGVLSESKEYYLDVKKKLGKEIEGLPKGSIKKRKISGVNYYYLQKRVGAKIKHHYLGKNFPEGIAEQIKRRKALKAELKKVNDALKMVRRAVGRRK